MNYQTIPQLLKNNENWVEQMTINNPDYFKNMAKNQEPPYLWIGCSDSRVPPNLVTGTEPGEIFIHRNIANMVVSTDYNLHSVLAYAVEHLHVKHIIVCGHYNCGGIKAAMGSQSLGSLDNWLNNIRMVRRLHAQELEALGSDEERTNRLVELNVIEQVHHLAGTNVIQRAWKSREFPTLHGWVYDLNNGKISQLLELTHKHELDEIYAFNNV